MAIKIINGKAVVVSEDTSSSSPTVPPPAASPQPTAAPAPKSELFSSNDPKFLLSKLAELGIGMVPGASDIKQAYTDNTLSPPERLRKIQEGANPFRLGSDLVKGALGIIPRIGLSISDLFGGPTQANLPVLGPQQSYQSAYRQSREAGAGQAASAGVAALQPIFDIALGKFMTGKPAPTKAAPAPEAAIPQAQTQPLPMESSGIVPKPAGYYGARAIRGMTPDELVMDLLNSLKKKNGVVPTDQELALNALGRKAPVATEAPAPSNAELALSYLEKTRGMKGEAVPPPAPAPAAPAAVPAPASALLPKPKAPFTRLVDEIFLNTDEKVARMGPAGKKLSDLYNQSVGEQGWVRGNGVMEIKNTIPKLNPAQQEALWALREKGTPSLDPQVLKANDALTSYFTNRQKMAGEVGILVDDASGAAIGNPQTYISHMLNDKGLAALKSRPETFFKKFAEANNISELEARTVWLKYIQSKRTPRAGFEMKREFKIPDEWLEKDPAQIALKYNDRFARRYALSKYFGKNYELADQLAAQTGMEGGNPNVAKEFVDLAVGRTAKEFEVEQAISDLTKRVVQTKLTPMSALPNFSQGILANTNMFGVRNSVASMLKALTPEGRAWARKTGSLGESFYKDFSVSNKIWSRVSGFPLSEDLNYVQVSNGAKMFIEGAYKELRNDPTNKLYSAKLDDLGVPQWRESLAKGEALSERQVGIGSLNATIKSIFPKVPGKMPSWANSGVGRATYLFNHYQFQNPKFLLSEFKYGTLRGIGQLAKTSALAALIGEPIADLIAAFKGENRPDDKFLRIADNILTVEGGVPFQFIKEAAKTGGWQQGLTSGIGGPMVGGAMATAGDLFKAAVVEKNIPKALEKTGRHFLKGDIPYGPAVPAGSMIEKLIPKATY